MCSARVSQQLALVLTDQARVAMHEVMGAVVGPVGKFFRREGMLW